MLAYRLLLVLVRMALRAFFKRIEVVGLEHVPRRGPVLFCGNHPNSLLDPALITATCGRIVHFAAKDVLFRSPLLRFVLTRFGAVPVQRPADHGAQIDNDAAFSRLYEVLAAGRTMGIFPEGLSHHGSQVARLKTGAARIALGFAARHPDAPLTIVPCGLHYVQRDRFRSSVLVQYGEPIVVDAAWRPAPQTPSAPPVEPPPVAQAVEPAADPAPAPTPLDDRERARALTGVIDAAIRALTVNADDWETLRVLDGVRRLYQPPRIALRDRVELARRFSAVYPTVKDDPRVVALYRDVEAYLDTLAALGVGDRDVVQHPSGWSVALRVFEHTLLLFVWLPLALVGAPIHLPVGLFLYFHADRLAPRKDVLATTKFLLGFALLTLLYVGLAAVAAAVWGPLWGLLALFGLPSSGWAAIVVARHFDAIDRRLTSLLGRFWLRRRLRELRAERVALEARVVAAVDALRPADMVLLFPRES